MTSTGDACRRPKAQSTRQPRAQCAAGEEAKREIDAENEGDSFNFLTSFRKNRKPKPNVNTGPQDGNNRLGARARRRQCERAPGRQWAGTAV